MDCNSRKGLHESQDGCFFIVRQSMRLTAGIKVLDAAHTLANVIRLRSPTLADQSLADPTFCNLVPIVASMHAGRLSILGQVSA